jgi:hypothetical protein
LTGEEAGTPLLQSTIANQQSAMKARRFGLDKLPLAGRGRYGECERFFRNLQEGTLFAGNSE